MAIMHVWKSHPWDGRLCLGCDMGMEMLLVLWKQLLQKSKGRSRSCQKKKKKRFPFVVGWMVNIYNGKGDGYRAEKSLTRQEKSKKGREKMGEELQSRHFIVNDRVAHFLSFFSVDGKFKKK